jgi:hypothetical protein
VCEQVVCNHLFDGGRLFDPAVWIVAGVFVAAAAQAGASVRFVCGFYLDDVALCRYRDNKTAAHSSKREEFR